MNQDVPVTRDQMQAVLQAWTEIGLDAFRTVIDRQALAMATADERSQKSRQQLSLLVKAVKQQSQKPDQDLSVTNKALVDTIKSFQKEVDELTKRGTYAESCFKQVYSVLYPAPDPVNTLRSALLLEQEQNTVALLRKQIAEYDAEFDKFKNQQTTIRKLEDRVRELDQRGSMHAASTVEIQSRQFEMERSQMIKDSKMREQELQQEIQRCRDLLSKTQHQVDELQSRLFSIHDRKDQDSAARDNDFNRIFEELQTANNLLTVAKNENADLQASLLRASDISTNEVVIESKRQAQLAQQRMAMIQHDYSAALEEIETLRMRLNQDESSRSSIARRYEIQIQELESTIQALRDSVKALPSMDEYTSLKNQLKLLQMVQFNAVEDGEAVTELEKNLLEKCRKAESDMVRMRCEDLALSEKLRETEQALREANEKNSLAASMIEKLERNVSDSTRRTSTLEASLSPTGNISSSHDQALIIQRDHFKRMSQSLELEKASIENKNQSLFSQLATLQSDNEKLCQKLRAIQTYNRKSSPTNDIEAGLVVSKYEKILDEKQNPFTQYNHAQKQRSYAHLNVMEKVILNSARMCLGNKTLRTGTFFYILALHALVFVSLITHTFLSHCPKTSMSSFTA